MNGLKRMLGADDALDVFGVHGVGGILGALLTGVFNSRRRWAVPASSTGSPADRQPDYSIATLVWIQAQGGRSRRIVWSGVVAYAAYKIVDLMIGAARLEEEEREGLDINSHGESAYRM